MKQSWERATEFGSCMEHGEANMDHFQILGSLDLGYF